MVSQAVIKILGLIYRLYLTNREGFGDEGNAIYSSGFQIYALLLTLSSIGVPNAISKLISEKTAIGDNAGAHRIFKVCFVIFSLVGFGGTLVLSLSASCIANELLQIPEAELTLIALAPSIFFVSVSSVIRGYFNGRKQLKVSAYSQTIEQVFKALLTICIVEVAARKTNNNTVIMAACANLGTTLATFLGIGYLFLYYKAKRIELWTDIISSVKHRKERVKTIIKNVFKISIPITLSALLGALHRNIDAFTVVRGLKAFMEETEAKMQYGILSGKIDTLIVLPLSFNIAFSVALVPTISELIAKKDYKGINRKIKKVLEITMVIGLVCTIGMFVFSEIIMKLLFPNAIQGAMLLKIGSLSIIFMLLSQTISGILQGLGKVIISTNALLIGIIVKLVLNTILIPIPNVGIYGAVISSTVCHMISCAIQFAAMLKICTKKEGF